MATTKKAEKKDPVEAVATAKNADLEFEDGYWWIVSGTKKVNVGRSRRYAENMLEQYK